MTVYRQQPGDYLRTMREADGKTIDDVRVILCMLKLVGLGRVWAAASTLNETLIAIEQGRRGLNEAQLRSLSIVFPFSLAHYRRLDRALALALEAARG